MITMENNSEEQKSSIINAAVHLYITDNTRFNLYNIAKEAGCEVGQIQQFFPGKQAILRGFYDQIPDMYRSSILEIQEYETLTVGEKVANYIYTTFDVLSMHRDFSESTINNMVLSRHDTYWHKESKHIFKSMIIDDNRIPGANTVLLQDFVYDIIVREYMQLIRFWLQDDSPGSERTLALVDKLTGFGSELLYSGVIDKGFDLGKYLLSNDIWKFRFSSSLSEIDRIRQIWWDRGMSLTSDLQGVFHSLKKKAGEQCTSAWSFSNCAAETSHKQDTANKKSVNVVEIPVTDEEDKSNVASEKVPASGRKSGKKSGSAPAVDNNDNHPDTEAKS